MCCSPDNAAFRLQRGKKMSFFWSATIMGLPDGPDRGLSSHWSNNDKKKKPKFAAEKKLEKYVVLIQSCHSLSAVLSCQKYSNFLLKPLEYEHTSNTGTTTAAFTVLSKSQHIVRNDTGHTKRCESFEENQSPVWTVSPRSICRVGQDLILTSKVTTLPLRSTVSIRCRSAER